jgi:hypothetical protein
MEILNSGSFINLENQEKIEQLIFTAKEIAKAAVETDGFINSEENNRRMAIEIWQGAEYMCRDFEEANIKNIFVRNFLERLREIRGVSQVTEISPVPLEVSETIKKTVGKDEFLGIVETNKIREPKSIVSDFSSNETDEESNIDDSFQSEMSDLIFENDKNLSEIAKNDEFLAVEAIVKTEEENENSLETESQDEIIQTEAIEVLNNQNAAVKSIALPEKEPYQFDKCTVTATIQLLPTETGIRRVVLSVRTHDFAPQISVVELTGEANPERLLLSALRSAFEKYKSDLPIKVINKLKEEKSKVKKQPNKTISEAKTNGVSNTTPAANRTVGRAENETSEQTAPRVTIPKPPDTVQGNLFG